MVQGPDFTLAAASECSMFQVHYAGSRIIDILSHRTPSFETIAASIRAQEYSKEK